MTDIFCENGHDGKTLQNIISNFEKKTRSTNRYNNNNNNNNNNNKTDKEHIITFPWIPKIEPKIKKEMQKFGFRLGFQTDPNLKNILCRNKDKLIPSSFLGVDQENH